jgi:hypothetical protein
MPSSDPETLMELAWIHLRLHASTEDEGWLLRAVRTYATVVRDAPHHPEMDAVLYRLARTLELSGQRLRALQMYHRILRYHRGSPFTGVALVAFAEHFASAGDAPGAGAFWERAVERGGGLVALYARYRLAWLLRRRGRTADARMLAVDLHRALDGGPRVETGHAEVASALVRDWCALASTGGASVEPVSRGCRPDVLEQEGVDCAPPPPPAPAETERDEDEGRRAPRWWE